MGYCFTEDGMKSVWSELEKRYDIYAPKCFAGKGRFSDTDCVRYGQVHSAAEIVFDKKAEYSAKEFLLPNAETLFYFTEDHIRESACKEKEMLIFLRSCDLHAIKRLDAVYLEQGFIDGYYKRLRDKVRFVLMGCPKAFDTCFCVDMGTNKSDDYDMSMDKVNDKYYMDCKMEEWTELFAQNAEKVQDVQPAFVTETGTHVNLPTQMPKAMLQSDFWREYDGRCIACGRCNFVCPTCTCFTMQDMYYTENGKAGERRRVWASCMVDGYADVAGGGTYRKKHGERMRYKVLHKVWDFQKKHGYPMCVGCGRCDDICPEYISFSHCVNELEKACKEVMENE